jgi:hypothetical protein
MGLFSGFVPSRTICEDEKKLTFTQPPPKLSGGVETFDAKLYRKVITKETAT